MITRISVVDALSSGDVLANAGASAVASASASASLSASGGAKYVTFPFYDNGVPVEDAPRWGMTLRAAGSMRFRWNETNPTREKMLAEICGVSAVASESAVARASAVASVSASAPLFPVPLELIHSKTVYCIEKADDTFQKQGDGMITKNRSLLPVVTVADCMPIFICDRKSGAFGVLHSGWKGTGIVAEAVRLLCEKFGADVANIFVALGPHIHDCCYIVDEERAAYFVKNFGTECVTKICEEDVAATRNDIKTVNENNRRVKYRLSLEASNSLLLKKIGVPESHVTVASDCTCCCDVFGSFRREACGQGAAGKSSEELSRLMTVQAAFCGYVS